jgi:hypothetical protein
MKALHLKGLSLGKQTGFDENNIQFMAGQGALQSTIRRGSSGGFAQPLH